MIAFGRFALSACGAAFIFAGIAGADIASEDSIPDPARAWELRNLSPLEAWLESATSNAGEIGGGNGAESIAVLRARAWLARRDGEITEALTLIDSAIERAPDQPALRVDRAAFRADLIEDAGALKSLRIARDVRKDLEHALAVAPEHADALAALAAFHLRAPGIAGGDSQEAAALLARLGRLAPSRRMFREASEFADQGRFGDAVERIAEAISQAGSPRPNWRIRMGDWLGRLDRVDGAVEAYREALLEAPQHAEAMYALGRLSAESGLAEDAGIDALQRFIALPRWPQDPEVKLAWWHLGRIHANAGCVERAEAAFRRALALDPDWRDARRSLQDLGEVRGPGQACPSAAELPAAG